MRGLIIPSIVVEKLVFGGKALARWQGRVILIEGALVGEHLEIEITQEKRDYCLARIVKILKASEHRVKPLCSHFGVCGGCDWQYMDYPAQLRAKEFILQETMKRLANLDLKADVVASPQEWSYRCRGQWHWSGKEWQVCAKSSSFQCPFRECPVSHPLLLSSLKNSPKHLPKGRYRLMLCGSQSVLTEWQKYKEGSLKVKGKEIFFTVNGFFQNNWSLLVPWLDFIIKDLSGEVLWDLYAGTGLLSAFLSDSFERIVLVETVGESLKLARKNINKPVQLIPKSVLDFLRSTNQVADCVLVNPPRTGLGKAVCQELLRLGPGKLIYVSCNPSTLARDMSQIKTLFDIQEAKIFDFYPQTYHMEVVLKLKRKTT